jgi:hypothetical protein
MNDLEAILDFWRTHYRLSEEGHCDSSGGAESRRVFEEWSCMGTPQPVELFIRWRSNETRCPARAGRERRICRPSGGRGWKPTIASRSCWSERRIHRTTEFLR